jgi:hypothetical protein
MKACGHPHIVGTECDVLFVPEAQDTIRKKVDAMMSGAAADGYSENASGAVSLVRQIVAEA